MEQKRWIDAQMSEMAYWESSFRDEISFRKMCLSFYTVYRDAFNKSNLKTADCKMLDIGSGPYSILSVFDGKEKYAIDPLMAYFKTKVPEEFYESHNLFTASGAGEDLPYEKGYFDIAFCINTLDHASEPEKILEEANRVLAKDGLFLITLNHYAGPIVALRKLLEKIGLGDACHPHTYHLKDINRMLSMNGFRIIYKKIGDSKEMRQRVKEAGGQTSSSMKERISRAVKLRGWGYVLKQALVSPIHFIFNKTFKTYPDSEFLCQKEYCLR